MKFFELRYTAEATQGFAIVDSESKRIIGCGKWADVKQFDELDVLKIRVAPDLVIIVDVKN